MLQRIVRFSVVVTHMCALQTAEAKVSYHSGINVGQQQVYSVSMFCFVPEQLTSVSDDLYSHLSQDVRLHTPKVPAVFA